MYKFFSNGKDIVVCVSTFANKRVRGVAKCSGNDVFDFEKGVKLAKARVDYKIALMRVEERKKRFGQVNTDYLKAEAKAKRVKSSLDRAYAELYITSDTLEEIEASMN